jgi:predicted nucleic acid-binding protein
VVVALALDTGPLLAALDAADPDHEPCAALVSEAEEDLVVPALVLAELDYWCERRLSPDAWAHVSGRRAGGRLPGRTADGRRPPALSRAPGTVSEPRARRGGRFRDSRWTAMRLVA